MATTQFSVVVENSVGKAAEVLNALAKAKVDIRAASVSETAEFGVMRLVVNNVTKARQVLKKKGLTFSAESVLAVVVKDKPGSLGKMLGPIRDAKVNIDYFYASTCDCSAGSCGCGPEGCDSIIIVRTSDNKAAEKALKKAGYKLKTR